MSGTRPDWLASEDELANMSPRPMPVPRRTRQWLKVTRFTARKGAGSDELPSVMRVWFAAMDRCDSEGRADFNSGELASIAACGERALRNAIAKGKRAGLLSAASDARHVYLMGVTDQTPSARRTTKRRRIAAVGRRYASTRDRQAA